MDQLIGLLRKRLLSVKDPEPEGKAEQKTGKFKV